MRKLLSCRFDIDTTLPMRTEMDWLIYNDSLEHAQIVLEDQELNQRGKAAFCGLPSFRSRIRCSLMILVCMFLLSLVFSKTRPVP